MPLLETLKSEHETVKNTLEKLVDTTDRAVKTRTSEWERLKSQILPHQMGEEKVFYPYLMEHGDEADEVREGVEEHRVTRMLMKDIEKTDVDDPQWHAKVKVLRELVTHHIDEEEREIFEMARKTLDDEQAQDLDVEFKETRDGMDPAKALRRRK